MKRIILVIAISLIGVMANAQKSAVLRIFEQYENMEGVTSVKVSKAMFNLLRKFNFDDEDLNNLRPLLQDVNSLQLIITELPDSADAAKRMKKLPDLQLQMLGLQSQINAAVEKLNYAELITVNSKGQKIRLLTNESSSDILNNLLFSFTSAKQNILMLLDGKIPLDKANAYIEKIDQ